MEQTLHIFFVWMHILGIALFLGPQVFLAFAWIPASRGIEHLPTRVQAMRTITRRFGYIGGLGLVLIIVAGSYLIATWRDYYGVPEDESFTAIRYGLIFIIKMSILVVMLAFLAFHTFVVGPRLLELNESLAAGGRVDETELRSARLQSMAASIGTLVLTVVILVLGAMLGTPGYSLQPL